jgi:adenylyl-sulfate kinase
MTSSNVTWHEGQVAPDQRSEILRSRGATLWMTGLSGSGKSTLASAVEKRLVLEGRGAYLLDGDNLRTGLNADLGFTREARQENARRTAEVARLFADAGLVAIVALISPYAESRRWARQLHHSVGLPFAEIYMEASVDLCATRDAKGLYARVTSGSISSFTGVDDPYEVPDAPDLVIEPRTSVGDAVDAVVEILGRIEG